MWKQTGIFFSNICGLLRILNFRFWNLKKRISHLFWCYWVNVKASGRFLKVLYEIPPLSGLPALCLKTACLFEMNEETEYVYLLAVCHIKYVAWGHVPFSFCMNSVEKSKKNQTKSLSTFSNISQSYLKLVTSKKWIFKIFYGLLRISDL